MHYMMELRTSSICRVGLNGADLFLEDNTLGLR